MNGLNYFMYICENVESHESKCTIPKRISSCFVIFRPAMQFFLHYFFRIVLFCCNPQYKLVLLLEKYLFLCKYPRGYFVSKCQDTVKKKNCIWFLKIIIETYTLLWFTLTTGIKMEEMSILLVFFASNWCSSQAEPFEYLSCFSHSFLQN